MFAQAMIPHHQQAVAMSDMILAKDGMDAEVTDWAAQSASGVRRRTVPLSMSDDLMDAWGTHYPALDAVVTLTETDADAYRALLPDTEIDSIPNAVPTRRLNATAPRLRDHRQRWPPDGSHLRRASNA